MSGNSSGIKAGYESIRLSFSKKTTYEKIIDILFVPLLFVALYIVAGILSHTFSDSGIPNEYRESANVLMTMELMKGGNPYSLSALDGAYPPMIYLYGPLYSLVTAFIGKGVLSLFPAADIVLLHYFVTFFCIMLTAVLGFIMVTEKTASATLGLAAFIFLINCSWRYNYVNAVPDSMGLAIMVLILFFMTRERLKGREFICAALTVAVFFTKQYYLLIAGTAVAFFFLTKGIKSALKYLITLIVFFAVTVFLLRLSCPLFETYMLYLAKGPGTGIASTVRRGSVKMSGAEYNLQQIMSLGGIFVMFFLTEAIGCIYYLGQLIRQLKTPYGADESGVTENNGGEIKGSRLAQLRDRLTAAGVAAGIDSFDLLMLLQLAVSGICLTYLGRNDGAWLSYYLELFMPALIMGAIVLFKKLSAALSENGIGKFNQRTTYLILSIYLLFFMGFTIMRADERLPVSPLSEDDYTEWKRAESVLDENKGDMYLYPVLGYYGIHNGIYIYNTGQPFVVSKRFYESYHKHPDMMKRYPYAEDIFTSHFAYREKILEKVRNGEYSVVSYIEGTDEVFETSDLMLKYKKVGTYALRTGRQVWDVELWVLE